jgi:pimeloyl-ACP methyl ester carboxylesterase
VIVLLHGFMDTPHTWDLVRPMLEREHAVLAPALPGHLGGRPLQGDFDLASTVEAVMDAAGAETAHLVGNSLGGYLALVLATRGRAESVVAIAPAGGPDHDGALELQEELAASAGRGAPAALIAATADGRRRATALLTVRHEHLSAELVTHLIAGVAGCDAAALIAHARLHGWPLDPLAVRCPVRVLWGLEDRLLPWPRAAERYRGSLDAEWIELDGVGHAPQLDVPLETAQLILGFTR